MAPIGVGVVNCGVTDELHWRANGPLEGSGRQGSVVTIWARSRYRRGHDTGAVTIRPRSRVGVTADGSPQFVNGPVGTQGRGQVSCGRGHAWRHPIIAFPPTPPPTVAAAVSNPRPFRPALSRLPASPRRHWLTALRQNGGGGGGAAVVLRGAARGRGGGGGAARGLVHREVMENGGRMGAKGEKMG